MALKGRKRRAMLSYIEAHTREHYSEEEALAEINAMLRPCSELCRAEFYSDAVKIRNSYLVRSGFLRHQVCAVIAATDFTCRSMENLSAEWLLHNICYALGIRRASAIDVDLDYTRDRRPIVALATWIMDVLDLE